MSNTMNEFINTINEINKLEEQKQQIRKRFASSTEELSECFQYIIGAKLEGRNNCSLTVDTCSELYAKELKEIGFEVKENRNYFGTLCGYRISWTM